MNKFNKCICGSNWKSIIEESEPLFNKLFLDDKGEAFRFIGILWAEDDYYYCMMGMDGRLERGSCVGSLEMYGYTLLEDE